MVLSSDASRTVEYVSANASKHTVHTQSDLLGRSLDEFVCPEDRRKLRQHLVREDDDAENASGAAARKFFHVRMETEERGEFEHVSIMGRYKLMGE